MRDYAGKKIPVYSGRNPVLSSVLFVNMEWLKYQRIYFSISIILIAVGIYSLLNWGLRLSVDFRGGAILEYKIDQDISTEEAVDKIEKLDIEVVSVQSADENTYLFRLSSISSEQKILIKDTLDELAQAGVEERRFETVGPSIGPELIKKTVYAIIFAAGGILLWVAFQFKSFKFGVSAILAMFHDSFILIGTFSLLGHFANAEVDFLFVTALLTTLSFSVHDTIVVYDRIRESQKVHAGDLIGLANRAITETMVRSLNNSFTIIFMLVALVLLGGTTIKWFAIALFIGTVLGTYSSPFVAVPLLVVCDELVELIQQRRKG